MLEIVVRPRAAPRGNRARRPAGKRESCLLASPSPKRNHITCSSSAIRPNLLLVDSLFGPHSLYRSLWHFLFGPRAQKPPNRAKNCIALKRGLDATAMVIYCSSPSSLTALPPSPSRCTCTQQRSRGPARQKNKIENCKHIINCKDMY
jgi:hypothetical protein